MHSFLALFLNNYVNDGTIKTLFNRSNIIYTRANRIAIPNKFVMKKQNVILFYILDTLVKPQTEIRFVPKSLVYVVSLFMFSHKTNWFSETK